MKTLRAPTLLATAALATFVVGCSNNSVGPSPLEVGDQGAIQGVLAATPELTNDGVFEVGGSTLLAPALHGPLGAPAAAAADLDPYIFWRSFASHSRTFEFAFADTDTTGFPTTAEVTLRRNLTGTFHVVPRDPNNPGFPDNAHAVEKPLEDEWVRRFLFKRVQVGSSDHPVWRLAAASGVEVTSPGATSAITSVRVRTATKDTTLTDPMAFIMLRQVLRFAPEDTVNLTVTTPRNDDVVLLYHRLSRMRLQNNNDGTYTGTFHVGFLDGWRHFGVNVLSHGTLFDDAAPYDSKAWIFPYVILSMPAVDYLPS